MNIEVLECKNGEKTIKVNSLFLHSSYNPSKEAERFVSTLECPFNPKQIVVIEPALSYVVPYLHEKFPDAKLGYIKLSEDLPLRTGFDFELDFLNNQNNFDSYLCGKLNEQDLFNTYFISWPASANAFSELDNKVWNAIKTCTEQAKTILITREYFEKKWFINSANLISNINKTVNLKEKISIPVIICASGPSLKNNIELIKEKQNSFFIIALSSALSVLLKNKIIPDLVFTTDGGFWAGEHLKKCKNLTLALPLESYCPKKLLRSNNILPLVYEDGLSKLISEHTSITFLSCQRNGTVSGSALDFALNNSTQKIYFFGLDLSSQNGYQHTQPNELEANNCIKDNRIKTKEKRIFPGSLPNSSLKIYENWFKTQNFPENKIFRVIDKEFQKNNLGKIKDISNADFYEICKNVNPIEKKEFFIQNKARTIEINKKDCSNINEFLKEELKKEENQKQLFPLSFVLLSHLQKDSEQYNLQKAKIDKELNKLIIKLEKILNV